MIFGDTMPDVIRLRVVDLHEHSFRSRALRDACLCISWIKMMSIMCYITMFFVLKLNTKGEFGETLQILLLCGIVPAVLEAALLFVGAIKENSLVICLALFVCLLLALYDFTIGIMGVIHHILISSETVHYVLTMLFMLLAFSVFPVICHDAFIINTYRKVLIDQNVYPPNAGPPSIID